MRTLTPAVDWATSGLRVPTAAESVAPQALQPRRAAVCSYGYGGTIAHVLLEEAPVPARRTTVAQRCPQIFPLSGSVGRPAGRAGECAGRPPARRRISPVDRVADDAVGATLARAGPRRGVIAEGHDGPAGRTGRAGRPVTATRGWSPAPSVAGAADGAVWVFSGHGSHWAGMGRELLLHVNRRSPRSSTRSNRSSAPNWGSRRGRRSTTGDLGGTDRVQALTFAMQVGLAAVLRRTRGDDRPR